MAKQPQGSSDTSGPNLDDLSIDRPRLTPQGDGSPSPTGEDSTDSMGEGAKQGQGDKAEG